MSQMGREQGLLERLEAAIERRMAAASGMLDALAASDKLDRERAMARLRAAFERIHEAGALLPGGWIGLWILLLAFLAAPALLLQWSGNHHAFAVDVLLYLVTLALGGLLLGTLLIGYLTVSGDPFDERPVVIWAWLELTEGEDVRAAPPRGRRVAGTAAAVAATAAGLWVLQDERGWALELLCLVLLSPLIAALLATVSALARVRAQPRLSRRPRSPVPGDVALVNLLNLAYFCARSAGQWDEEQARRRILRECERVAAGAELELLGSDHFALRGDRQTLGWAAEQSARHAATLRALKRRLLQASRREQYDAFVGAQIELLAAAVEGDWVKLTSAEAPPRRQRRLRRAVTALVPSVLLAAAAFALPEIPGLADDPAAADSIRASLLVAALLALVAQISPASERAAGVIQSVADRFGPSRS